MFVFLVALKERKKGKKKNKKNQLFTKKVFVGCGRKRVLFIYLFIEVHIMEREIWGVEKD